MYLLPLAGPHVVVTLGSVVWRDLARGGGGREPAWVACELGLALTLQAAAFLALRWCWRAGGLVRWLLVLGMAAGMVLLIDVLVLVVIPSLFLIEDDASPEIASGVERCTRSDAALQAVRRSADLALARAGEAVVVTHRGTRLELLHEDCSTWPLGLSQDPREGPPFVVVGGAHLVSRWDASLERQDWYVVPAPGAQRVPAPAPLDASTTDGQPILSNDGRFVAWVARGGDAVPRVRLTSTEVEGRELVVSLEAVGPGGYVPLSADVERGEILLCRNYGEMVAVSLRGNVTWGPLVPEGVEASCTTFLRAGEGWVAWDAYREREAYRVAWSLSAGRGTHRIPKGRGVTSASVHPDGVLVAVSTTTQLNIGSIDDAVFVLDARDGSEVFRRALPAYARSEVAFLARTTLAYTEWDGTRATLRVVDLAAAIR